MNAINSARRMKLIERFENLHLSGYVTMVNEIEQLRQRVAELGRFHELDTKQIAYLFEERDALKQQRDELLAAAEAIEINAEECLDFDECTAMFVQIDDYHKLMEAIASVKEK